MCCYDRENPNNWQMMSVIAKIAKIAQFLQKNKSEKFYNRQTEEI